MEECSTEYGCVVGFCLLDTGNLDITERKICKIGQWNIFLISDWCGKAYSVVGGLTPGQVLGAKESRGSTSQEEQGRELHSSMASASPPAPGSCPAWVPAPASF